jgi:hypothetical protein
MAAGTEGRPGLVDSNPQPPDRLPSTHSCEPHWQPRLRGISGVALVLFAVLQTFAGVIDPDKNDPAVIGSLTWTMFHAAMFVGYALGVIGVVGLFLECASAAGWVAIGALTLTLLAHVFLAVIAFFQWYAIPIVAQSAAAPVTVNGLRASLSGPLGSGYLIVFGAAGVCFLAGYLLTAVAVRRSARFPAMASWSLVAGTLLGFVEFVVPAWTREATLLSGIVFDAGILTLGAVMLRDSVALGRSR